MGLWLMESDILFKYSKCNLDLVIWFYVEMKVEYI